MPNLTERDIIIYRSGVEGPAGTANAVPLFTVVRIAVPLFKAGRTGAANVPPRMRDCSARAYSTYAWASTVKLILTKAIFVYFFIIKCCLTTCMV